MSKPSIAFLGTGLMGAPMARRLLAAGYAVTVWNRNPTKAEALVLDGATLAATPATAVEDADVVFTMLSDGPAVEDVLFLQKVAGSLAEGTIFVDTSSIAPAIARDHAKRLAKLGVRHIDAPVSGGVVGANEGSLAIMAGGDETDVKALSDVFAALGRVTYVGPSGAGQICKLANQQIVATTIGAVAEAMIFARAGGADPAAFRDAIRGGFCESRILELHGGRMVRRDFEPGGPSRLQLKDLNAARDVADANELTLPLADTARAAFDAFVEGGGAEMDHSALLVYLEQINAKSKALQ
ncbi:NAD(P)-dependent oxidoreductase [Qingshengfaniella alkalisoli]|uniref:NAD(P)-dependent oxidoreductase n=1 Tax=Qingshengfaniella alkalisoli TaxID=2599296 RepID=A0A5B8J111_9RHOB|nr:NAD(P)-dependent oxidoreductase [Qingshengfaniella alkalisoli]QDY71584.1 NAD(P)-dependent oxidoreductase [Qingshengfaniella alkalisoli]